MNCTLGKQLKWKYGERHEWSRRERKGYEIETQRKSEMRGMGEPFVYFR